MILPNSADQKLMARVKKKVFSDDRNEASYYNPLKGHSIYEVVFPDGTTDEGVANLTAGVTSATGYPTVGYFAPT